MTRRTVAAILAPLPAFGWWASRLPLGGLLVLLALLLVVAATAGVGLGRTRPRRPPRTTSPEPVAAAFDTSPAAVLVTVPGVDVADLLARVVELERRASWVAGGVDDIEVYVNLPDPEADIVSFLDQLDDGDREAG